MDSCPRASINETLIDLLEQSWLHAMSEPSWESALSILFENSNIACAPRRFLRNTAAPESRNSLMYEACIATKHPFSRQNIRKGSVFYDCNPNSCTAYSSKLDARKSLKSLRSNSTERNCKNSRAFCSHSIEDWRVSMRAWAALSILIDQFHVSRTFFQVKHECLR